MTWRRSGLADATELKRELADDAVRHALAAGDAA